MKKVKIFSAFVFLMMLLAGCEEDANVKLPETEPKLVVTSFICPQDTFIKVWVKKTQPIFEPYDANASDVVPDATVIISDGASSAILVFDPSGDNDGYYKVAASSFPIVENKEYSLSVSTPDGKTASASTKVPQYSNVNFTGNGSYITTDSNSNGYTREYTIQYSWDDITGATNNYRIITAKAYLSYYYSPGDTLYAVYQDIFVNDEGGDGQQISDAINSTEEIYTSPGGGSDTLVGFNFYLYHVNADYYQYQTSLVRAAYGGDNPFAEPSLIYSNVTGGLGAFCAYNRLGFILQR